MINKRARNIAKLTECSQENNVVVDGYMSTEMLYNEMTKGGQIAVSYIEELKKQYNQEAQTKLEEDTNFEATLATAYREQKEKIDAHFEQKQALNKVNEAIDNYNTQKAKLKKAEEEYERAAEAYGLAKQEIQKETPS